VMMVFSSSRFLVDASGSQFIAPHPLNWVHIWTISRPIRSLDAFFGAILYHSLRIVTGAPSSWWT
jgi:hypothetical protein